MSFSRVEISRTQLAFTAFAVFAGLFFAITTTSASPKYDTILNLALVPVDPAAAKEFVQFSAEVNHPQTQYQLCSPEDLTSKAPESIFSRPHVTLMHFKAPADQKEREALLERLAPLVGQEIKLTIAGFERLNVTGFKRDDLLAGKKPNLQVTADWLAVDKTPDLLALQARAVAAIADPKACVTGIGDAYRPHVTLAAQLEADNTNRPEPQLRVWSQDTQSTLFKVVLAKTGPIGQIPGLVEPPKI